MHPRIGWTSFVVAVGVLASIAEAQVASAPQPAAAKVAQAGAIRWFGKQTKFTSHYSHCTRSKDRE